MSTLEQIKALGVRELSVKNQQATAVNPVKRWNTVTADYDEANSLVRKWQEFESLVLPPLPTSGIPDGTVLIEQVEPIYECFNFEQAIWEKITESEYNEYQLADFGKTRCILVFKQVKAEEPMIVKEDMICPVSKKYCDDECCTVGSECNLSGDGLISDCEQVKEEEPKAEESESAFGLGESTEILYYFNNLHRNEKEAENAKDAQEQTVSEKIERLKNLPCNTSAEDLAAFENKVDAFISKSVEPEGEQTAEGIEIKEIVLAEYRKGNIVIATGAGLQVMPLKDVVKQPAEGLLYDLNRNEAVVLSFITDPKWVNDYATVQVIRELKRQLEASPEVEEAKQGWISVKDNAPKEYGRYLIYRQKCGKIHFETWNNTGWAYNNNDITHWQNLPEPPQTR